MLAIIGNVSSAERERWLFGFHERVAKLVQVYNEQAKKAIIATHVTIISM